MKNFWFFCFKRALNTKKLKNIYSMFAHKKLSKISQHQASGKKKMGDDRLSPGRVGHVSKK